MRYPVQQWSHPCVFWDESPPNDPCHPAHKAAHDHHVWIASTVPMTYNCSLHTTEKMQAFIWSLPWHSLEQDRTEVWFLWVALGFAPKKNPKETENIKHQMEIKGVSSYIPFTHTCVGILVGTTGQRKATWKLSIAQSCKSCSNSSNKEWHCEGWPCSLPGHCSNQHIHPCSYCWPYYYIVCTHLSQMHCIASYILPQSCYRW